MARVEKITTIVPDEFSISELEDDMPKKHEGALMFEYDNDTQYDVVNINVGNFHLGFIDRKSLVDLAKTIIKEWDVVLDISYKPQNEVKQA